MALYATNLNFNVIKELKVHGKLSSYGYVLYFVFFLFNFLFRHFFLYSDNCCHFSVLFCQLVKNVEFV